MPEKQEKKATLAVKKTEIVKESSKPRRVHGDHEEEDDGDYDGDYTGIDAPSPSLSRAKSKLVPYNHGMRSSISKAGKEEHVQITSTVEDFGDKATRNFKTKAENFQKMETEAAKDFALLKESMKERHKVKVENGSAVTITWMLYMRGENEFGLTAPTIREAILNRKEEIFSFIRSMIGTFQNKRDRFALDWDEVDKKVFNDSSCTFPIYFPGVCMKITRNGVHITGPKRVSEFLGIANFLHGFFTKISNESFTLEDFNVTMLNVPVKLVFLDKNRIHPDRIAIHDYLKKAVATANKTHTGILWDNEKNGGRCCVQEVKNSNARSKGKKSKTYAGVNFRYVVKGESIRFNQGVTPKWPWVTIFDDGKFIIIFSNPAFQVKTCEFVIRLLMSIAEEMGGSKEASEMNEEDVECEKEKGETDEDDSWMMQSFEDF